MIDTLIIGNGPAGISAALYIKNYNKKVIVIGKDNGQLTKRDMIDNFYGTDKITGEDLINKGIEQAKNKGIEVIKDSVISIEKNDNTFTITTSLSVYHSKTIVIATGKSRSGLKVLGYQNYRGRGIHLCALCDGFFYKDKKIALIGDGKYMESELKELENYTKNITIITENPNYKNDKYLVINEKIRSFTGDKRLNTVETLTQQINVDGAFVALGFPGTNELAIKLGIITENSNILVDENMETNIEGCFAGGDCIGGKLQIAKAVYDGLKISSSVITHLKKQSKQ